MAENISGNNTVERKSWIDVVRGLAVMLVVIGHANPGTYPFFLLTSPVKMPLFFVVSGYLFNKRNGSYPAFFKNLFVRIILPWLFLGLFPILFMLPFKGWSFLPQYFFKMLSGDSIWFMPCFIIGEVLFFSILKYLGQSKVIVVLISLLVSFVGYLLIKSSILDYAMTNRAMTVQVFFAIGWFFRSYDEKLFSLNWKFVMGGIIAFLAISLVYYYSYPGLSIDVHMGVYPNLCLSLLQILLGCWLVFIIARAVHHFPKWSTQFGKDSLLIYIWSPYVMIVLTKLMGKVVSVENNFWWHTLIAIVTCCLCCLIALPINRYTPFLVGKK